MPFFAEHFNEVWSNNSVDVGELIEECPPAMASSMTHLLYGRVLSTVPPFRGLSSEVIGALCMRCHPLIALKEQPIIRQGEPGHEMYIIMSGEVEVTVRDDRTHTETAQQKQKRSARSPSPARVCVLLPACAIPLLSASGSAELVANLGVNQRVVSLNDMT